MAKELQGFYTFTPGGGGAGTIVVNGFYRLEQFQLITNITDQEIIFNFADTSKGATLSYNATTDKTTLTLETSTSGMSSTDRLQIFVQNLQGQEIIPSGTYQDPVEKLRVSNPQALIDTDFEYSLQATKWESVQLQNNIPGIFQRANEPAFQGSEITSIVQQSFSSGSGQVSVTNGTYQENGRSGMTANITFNWDDGNTFISAPFNIDFLGTAYNGVYVSTNGYFTFGSGSSQYWNMSLVDQPNIPAIKVFAGDRRAYWIGNRTIGSAPNRTWIVRFEGTNYYPQYSPGGTGSHVYEARFTEGGTGVEIHYVRNQSTSYTAAVQDGPGPSTSFLATWSGVGNSSSPYSVGVCKVITWGSSSTVIRTTVASPPASPFVIGQPIIIKETKDPIHLDGAFLITGVPSSTSFEVQSRSPTSYGSVDQKTDYTAVYTGGFFSNAELALSSIARVSGTTRARINFSSNHGLYVGSKLYVVDPNVSTGTWVGAMRVSRVYSDTAVEYNTDETSNYSNSNTLSSGQTKVYVRNEGVASHRYHDGGVQINPSSNSPNAQIIRQTRKYFRYQSGKGIQFSTGVLFKPVYDVRTVDIVTNTYIAGSNEVYEMNIQTDQEHGFTSNTTYKPGASVTISGFTVASGNNPYNGTFTIKNVTDRVRFTVEVDVSSGNGGVPSDTTPEGIPKVEVTAWNDAVVRSGLFDDQNGMFFEHDGTYLYAVKRSSTEQIMGVIAVNQNSSTVNGTDTKFLSQLEEEDYIVIKGVSYLITKIISDTQLTVSPDYKALSVSNAKIVKTNDTRVRQDSFNLDPVDGSGPTGYTLDSNKMQMVFIDYSWYGAGRIRWGLRLQDGSIQYIHQAPQNNVNTEAYMRSGNIPARFEISSKSKNGKLLASVTTGSSTLTIKESDAQFLPTNGTIVVNNEYMEYTKGGTGTTLGFASRTLNINNRNIGGKSSNSTANVNDTWLSANQNCSPSLSHWGTSTIMDGEFNTDKSYLFTASTASSVSVASGATAALVSVRLAPSVDYGIPGFYGVRNLINRSALALESIGLSVQGNFSVEVKINPESTIYQTTTNWLRPTNGSIAQYMDRSSVTGTFTGGDVVASFFADEGSNRFANSTYPITAIRELGNSILGGPNVYPDGPDVLTLFVKNNSGQTRQAYGRITWQEAQG